jgi:hypothetical protein
VGGQRNLTEKNKDRKTKEAPLGTLTYEEDTCLSLLFFSFQTHNVAFLNIFYCEKCLLVDTRKYVLTEA